MSASAVRLASDTETLQADLYFPPALGPELWRGVSEAAVEVRVRRAAILVHGQNWDGSGWRDIAPLFVARGVPALAINLRGHDGSTGVTDPYRPGRPWSPVTDLAAAKAYLREHGAAEIALVGASLGGHAALGSALEGDVECVVSVSAPVTATPDELVRRLPGRKLFVCADEDSLGAAPHVRAAFAVAAAPKALYLVGGREHSRGVFNAPYGREVVAAIVEFACQRA